MQFFFRVSRFVYVSVRAFFFSGHNVESEGGKSEEIKNIVTIIINVRQNRWKIFKTNKNNNTKNGYFIRSVYIIQKVLTEWEKVLNVKREKQRKVRKSTEDRTQRLHDMYATIGKKYI